MRRRRTSLPAAVALAGALSVPAPSAAEPYEYDWSGQIEVVARRDFPSYAYHLDVDGHLAFVGTQYDGVLTFDLSDPENPVHVGTAPVPDAVYGVTARDGILYVAADEAGVFLFDVSRPDDPVLFGSVNTAGYARRLALAPSTGAARFAFVASDWRGVQVIDVGVPSEPHLAGELDTERALSVASRGDWLYVADDGGGILMVDATAPGDLHLVGAVDEPGAIEVEVVGTTLYVGGWDFFQIYDIADPGAPVARGRAEIAAGWPHGGYAVSNIHVEEGVAHLGAAGQGLYLADVTDAENPVIFSGIRAKSTNGVDRTGPWIVTAHAWGGGNGGSIQVIDSRGRPSPAPVGFLRFDDYVLDVAVSGDRAYTVGHDWFRVNDVTDPAQPEVLGQLFLPTASSAHEVALARPPYVVFTGATDNTLYVVDVSDASFPAIVGDIVPLNVTWDLHGVEVVGRWAWVGAWLRSAPGGLVLIDLENPENPVAVGTVSLSSGSAHNLEISNGIAHVVASGHLALVDVSDPLLPVVLSELPLGSGSTGLRVRDGLAYVALYFEGLKIFDVSDPYAPRLLSHVEGVYRATDVDLDGDFAYVSSMFQGVSVVDVSDPEAPFLVGATMVPPDQVGVTRAIEFANGVAFSGGTWGLAILPRHVPLGEMATAAPSAAGRAGVFGLARPNPFRASTTLAFHALRSGDARVAVYDAGGRLVRLLRDGAVDPGRHEIRWDGRDGSGRPVASGVYFVRLDGERGSHVRKVQRLR